ncbi:MAG: D-alanyl-D-alanine carboxypeptidase/D-alanyl-D-alanine-endopeptidase [Sphingomonadales bacterium]|nr:D-alanyl-D-alanine carboxypeptidase/D-alanyl-D-alanine-endopeptidase [Sphingomonadales bacterium]
MPQAEPQIPRLAACRAPGGRVRLCLSLAVLLACAPAHAQGADGLRQQVEAVLASAPAGTRFGVLAIDETGKEIVAINADQRFIPASNTKLFTTAAALELLGKNPAGYEADGVTTLALVPVAGGAPDVVLAGGGAALSTAQDCTRRCFGGLVNGIAAKARKVGNVIADDTAFTDQRWSPGMSWNNIPTDSGTAASAMIVDDNELPLVVTAARPGEPAAVELSSYFTLRNETQSTAEGETKLGFERAINGRELRVFGTIRTDAAPWHDQLGIDDPADYAAWMLREGLIARGVKVAGKIVLRHRAVHGDESRKSARAELALAVTPAPLDEEVALINKRSQNLHAEVLLRRLGQATLAGDIAPGDEGSLEAGLAAMRGVLDKAGIPRGGYDFSDGSGMSTYNRVSPRAAVALLRWGKAQGWGAVWRASLPVGGVDGTLRHRFAGTPLAGKLWAKTGTLNATNALSGYLTATSGRELIFSILANDVPEGSDAVPAMDAAVALIAAAN